MKWRAKNFHETIYPMSTLFAIVGHGVFEFPIGRRRFIFSIIYSITVTLLYGFAFVYTLQFSYSKSWYTTEEKIFFAVIYVNIAIAGIAQILSWCHETRFTGISRKLTLVDETLERLGTSLDYGASQKMIIILITFWVVALVSLNATDILWLLDETPIHTNLWIAMVLHHPVHVNSIVALNFSSVVRALGMRFRVVNEILEKTSKINNKESIDSNYEQQLSINNCFTNIFALQITLLNQNVFNSVTNPKRTVQVIKHVHLELSMLSKDLEQAYGIQMALEMAAYFVMFTGLLFDLYNIFMNPNRKGQSLRKVVLSTWLFVYFIKLLVINNVCDNVSSEARRTGQIIHRFSSRAEFNTDPELPEEIQQFSYQLTQYPVTFSPAGLFTLGHKFVRGFLGSVTTYLVILIQMS